MAGMKFVQWPVERQFRYGVTMGVRHPLQYQEWSDWCLEQHGDHDVGWHMSFGSIWFRAKEDALAFIIRWS